MIVQQRRWLRTSRTLGARLLAAQEEERAWVARELHDDLIQRVALLARELDALESTPAADRAERQRRVAGLRAEMYDLIEGIRAVAHRMHPAVLDTLGLVPALGVLAEELAVETGLRVTVEAAVPPGRIPAEVGTVFYRIAQEALRNTIKHAGVAEALVRVELEAGGVRLVVADGGAGFTPGAPAARAGLGLVSMAERVRLVHGVLQIDSSPGAGTRLAVWAPLPPASPAS